MAEKKEERDMAKEYDGLRLKYGLPELGELDKEFSIGTLEPCNLLLRTVLNRMNDRTEHMKKILGDIIQPESHVSDMHEAENFSESEKTLVSELFKRLSYLGKDMIIVDFDYTDQAAADMINKFAQEWKSIKPDFLKVLALLRDAWKSGTGIKDEFGYFG